MTDTTWTVKTQSNEHVVNAITEEWPNIVIGEETFVRVWIHSNGGLTVENGETHTVSSETIEFYDDVTVEDGGELVVEDGGEVIVGTVEERWSELEAYTDYAGQAATGRGIDHTPWFREQLPNDARVDSIVIGFEPNTELQDRGVDAVWGVLTGGFGRRNNVLSNHELELDVFVLDRIGEYGSVNELKSDLEA